MTRRKQQSPKRVNYSRLEVRDEPLDLSLKSNSALDLTTKKRKIIEDEDSSPSSSSTLKSLQQKFGGNAFLTEKTKTMINRPLAASTTFGGQVYHSALYGSQISTSSVSSNSIPLRSPAPKSMSPKINNTNNTNNNNNNNNSNNYQSLSPSSKFISYSCQCGSAFDCLYDLTVHMQKTKHKHIAGKKSSTIIANGSSSLSMANGEDLPKLVRGQDMWLSQGSEQTRQILRCITCCESFSSLAELTVHMMHTKHYSNFSSQFKNNCKETTHCEICSKDVEVSKFGQHAQKCVKRSISKSPELVRKMQHDEMSSPKLPTNKTSPLPLVLAPPPASDDDIDGTGALKAMQNFIERSFLTKSNKETTTSTCSSPPSHSSTPSPNNNNNNNNNLIYNFTEDSSNSTNISTNKEHPLDSLQRLIQNNTEICTTSTTPITTSSTAAPNIILVNPIVTVVSPTTNNKTTSPLNTEKDQQQTELRCPVCNRVYVSKGSYRYHISRCHVRPIQLSASSFKGKVEVKKEIGDKLSKYYKLASELSSCK